MSKTFSDWLKSVKATHLGTRNVICVTTETTVKETFELLYSNHILSCPVIDPSKEAVGMVDLLDIVSFVVKFMGETHEEEDFNKQWDAAKGTEAFSTTPVRKIVDLSGTNKLVTLPHNSNLYDISVKLSQGCHRVWITDSEGKLHRLVTQSAVLGYICSLDNNAPLHLFDHVTLDSSSQFNKKTQNHEIQTAWVGDTAISAFQKMHEAKVSAIAVVDENGHLVSNLSARDLRAMKTFNFYMFSALFKTVREFISIVRQEELKARIPAISCSPNDSVSSTLRRLVGIRVHRLWIKDSHHKPTGVVSTTDLLNFLVHH